MAAEEEVWIGLELLRADAAADSFSARALGAPGREEGSSTSPCFLFNGHDVFDTRMVETRWCA